MTFPPGSRTITDADAEMRRLAAGRKLPGHVRELLGHAVTVIKPGETLIIATDPDWTPNQVAEYQRFLDAWHHDPDPDVRLPFRAIALAGAEFAVREAGQ